MKACGLWKASKLIELVGIFRQTTSKLRETAQNHGNLMKIQCIKDTVSRKKKNSEEVKPTISKILLVRETAKNHGNLTTIQCVKDTLSRKKM